MSPFRSLAFVALVALLPAGGVRADDEGDSDFGGGFDIDPGPAAIVPPTSNALVAIRRSEPRSEVAIGVGAAVTDQPARTISDFPVPARSGLQRGALELEGSWSPSPRWEVFGTFNAMAFHWMLVGGKNESRLTLGAATVGATWVPVSLRGGRLDGGVFLRLLLPTSLELSGVHAWGIQPGLTFRGVATRWLAWFGGLSFRVGQSWGTLTTRGGARRANATNTGGSAMLGVAFVPAPWLRVVAQVSGNVPFERGSDQLSPGLAVRFLEGPLAVEIAGTVPVLGQLRTFSAFARVSWRFDR